MFSLRIVTVDHYLATPVPRLDPGFSRLGGWEVWKVPVIRIFGVTSGGQKACLHVHGVFPYLCVPFDEDSGERADKFAPMLASELDLLLNTAAGRAASRQRHVHHVEAFRGTPLYGFHNKERTFLKIYLYNPYSVKKVADLLLSGMVLKKVMQPHEAHIPFALQFLIDHNLHGMSFVNVGKFKFRRANLDLDSSKLPVRNSRSDTHVWVLRDMPPDMFLDLQVQKQTTCELELDCSSEDILNPRDADKGGMNPGLSALWRDEEERRARRGDTSTLVAPLSHDRLGVMKTDSELFYIRKLDKLLRAAQSTDSPSQASSFKHAAGRRTPSSGVLSAVGDSASQILDSQDLSLAEMLARVTANESWADLELSRDADSVLSVRCSQRSGGSGQQQPVVEDEEEEDEEEQTTREMSQVFNLGSECLDAPELGGPAKGRPAPRSGSSSSSSDSEGDQPYSPSQLDGTDDGRGRPSNSVTELVNSRAKGQGPSCNAAKRSRRSSPTKSTPKDVDATDDPGGGSGAVAQAPKVQTADAGTQTGLRPPVLVRQLLRRARPQKARRRRRETKLSLSLRRVQRPPSPPETSSTVPEAPGDASPASERRRRKIARPPKCLSPQSALVVGNVASPMRQWGDGKAPPPLCDETLGSNGIPVGVANPASVATEWASPGSSEPPEVACVAEKNGANRVAGGRVCAAVPSGIEEPPLSPAVADVATPVVGLGKGDTEPSCARATTVPPQSPGAPCDRGGFEAAQPRANATTETASVTALAAIAASLVSERDVALPPAERTFASASASKVANVTKLTRDCKKPAASRPSGEGVLTVEATQTLSTDEWPDLPSPEVAAVAGSEADDRPELRRSVSTDSGASDAAGHVSVSDASSMDTFPCAPAGQRFSQEKKKRPRTTSGSKSKKKPLLVSMAGLLKKREPENPWKKAAACPEVCFVRLTRLTDEEITKWRRDSTRDVTRLPQRASSSDDDEALIIIRKKKHGKRKKDGVDGAGPSEARKSRRPEDDAPEGEAGVHRSEGRRRAKRRSSVASPSRRLSVETLYTTSGAEERVQRKQMASQLASSRAPYTPEKSAGDGVARKKSGEEPIKAVPEKRKGGAENAKVKSVERWKEVDEVGEKWSPQESGAGENLAEAVERSELRKADLTRDGGTDSLDLTVGPRVGISADGPFGGPVGDGPAKTKLKEEKVSVEKGTTAKVKHKEAKTKTASKGASSKHGKDRSLSSRPNVKDSIYRDDKDSVHDPPAKRSDKKQSVPVGGEQKDTRKASSLKKADNKNQTADAPELQKECASRTCQISGSDQEATEKNKLAHVPESESVSGFTTDKEDSSNSTVDKEAGNLPAHVSEGDSSVPGLVDSHLRAKGPTRRTEKGGGSKEGKAEDKVRGHASKVVGKDKREEPKVRRSKSSSSTLSESGISVSDKLGNGFKQRHKESESDKKKEKHDVCKLGRDTATTEKIDKKATTDEATKHAEKAKPRISSSKPNKKLHIKTATAKTNNAKAPDNVAVSTLDSTIQSSSMALPLSAKSTLEQISAAKIQHESTVSEESCETGAVASEQEKRLVRTHHLDSQGAKHNTEHGSKSSTKKLISEASKRAKKSSRSPSRQALAAEKSGTEKRSTENSGAEDIAGASDPVTSFEKERKEKGIEKHNNVKEVRTHLTAAKLPAALDSAARNSEVSESTVQPTTSTSGPKQTKRGSVRMKNKLSIDPFENVQHSDGTEATSDTSATAAPIVSEHIPQSSGGSEQQKSKGSASEGYSTHHQKELVKTSASNTVSSKLCKNPAKESQLLSEPNAKAEAVKVLSIAAEDVGSLQQGRDASMSQGEAAIANAGRPDQLKSSSRLKRTKGDLKNSGADNPTALHGKAVTLIVDTAAEKLVAPQVSSQNLQESSVSASLATTNMNESPTKLTPDVAPFIKKSTTAVESSQKQKKSLVSVSQINDSKKYASKPDSLKRHDSKPDASSVVASSVDGSNTYTSKINAPKASALKADVPQANAPKADAPKANAPKADAPKVDAPKADAPKAAAPKAAAPKADAPKADAPKADALKADAPKADAPKGDAPKVDALKADAPKPDAPKADAPKADAPKADAPKADAPKADAPKADAPKADAPKADASKANAPKSVIPKANIPKAVAPKAAASKPNASKATPSKAKTLKADALKADALKTDASKNAAPKADAPKVDAPKADAPKADAPKADAPKADAPKADAPKADAPKADAAKANASKANAAKTSAAKTNAAKTNAAKTDAAKADTAKADTAKADTAKADTAKADTAKADTAKADTAKAETAKAETAKADTAKADTAKASLTKADPAKADPAKADAAKNGAAKGEAVRVDAPRADALKSNAPKSVAPKSTASKASASKGKTSKSGSSEADASKSIASKGSASKVNSIKTNTSKANVSKTNIAEGMGLKQSTSKAKISITKATSSEVVTSKNIVAAKQLSQDALTSSAAASVAKSAIPSSAKAPEKSSPQQDFQNLEKSSAGSSPVSAKQRKISFTEAITPVTSPAIEKLVAPKQFAEGPKKSLTSAMSSSAPQTKPSFGDATILSTAKELLAPEQSSPNPPKPLTTVLQASDSHEAMIDPVAVTANQAPTQNRNVRKSVANVSKVKASPIPVPATIRDPIPEMTKKPQQSLTRDLTVPVGSTGSTVGSEVSEKPEGDLPQPSKPGSRLPAPVVGRDSLLTDSTSFQNDGSDLPEPTAIAERTETKSTLGESDLSAAPALVSPAVKTLDVNADDEKDVEGSDLSDVDDFFADFENAGQWITVDEAGEESDSSQELFASQGELSCASVKSAPDSGSAEVFGSNETPEACKRDPASARGRDESTTSGAEHGPSGHHACDSAVISSSQQLEVPEEVYGSGPCTKSTLTEDWRLGGSKPKDFATSLGNGGKDCGKHNGRKMNVPDALQPGVKGLASAIETNKHSAVGKVSIVNTIENLDQDENFRAACNLPESTLGPSHGMNPKATLERNKGSANFPAGKRKATIVDVENIDTDENQLNKADAYAGSASGSAEAHHSDSLDRSSVCLRRRDARKQEDFAELLSKKGSCLEESKAANADESGSTITGEKSREESTLKSEESILECLQDDLEEEEALLKTGESGKCDANEEEREFDDDVAFDDDIGDLPDVIEQLLDTTVEAPLPELDVDSLLQADQSWSLEAGQDQGKASAGGSSNEPSRHLSDTCPSKEDPERDAEPGFATTTTSNQMAEMRCDSNSSDLAFPMAVPEGDGSGIHSFYMDDSIIGDLTKSTSRASKQPCRLTSEGLVALVPAAAPPHFEEVAATLDTCDAALVAKKRQGLSHWQGVKLQGFAPNSSFDVDFEQNPELRIAFCRDRTVVLTPARFPPSSKAVRSWAKSRRGPPEAPATRKGRRPSPPALRLDRSNEEDDFDPSFKEDLDFVRHSTPVAKEDGRAGTRRRGLATLERSERKGRARLELSLPPSGQSAATGSSTRTSLNLSTATTASPAASPLKPLDFNIKEERPGRNPALNSSTSQLDGPTRSGTFNFGYSGGDLQQAKGTSTSQMLTLLSVEVHVHTRDDLHPNPAYDPVQCIFYCFHNDPQEDDSAATDLVGALSVREVRSVQRGSSPLEVDDLEDLVSGGGSSSSRGRAPGGGRAPPKECGLLRRSGVINLTISEVAGEVELFAALVELVRRWDPDILVGYEIQKSSWGYLLERGNQLRLDLASMLSRVPKSFEEQPKEAGDPEGDAVLDRDVVVPGRVVLNLWRIMRKEVTLNIYTFENVYYHVVHRRVPLYSFKVLTEWFAHDTDLFRWRTVEHYVIRARGNLELLDRLDVVGKTSEMARIFGIQFFEVLSRGSQFRVESMMLRLARQRGLVALSPSVQQRARMRAMEFIPLVMEPQSHLYTSPVVVLDFQSLYPSVMIAHNYCFSTCLGRLDHFGSGEPFVFGCSSLTVPVTLLNILREYISVSPAGVAFVQSSVRRGVLPQMLEEILNTRLMVKQSMKECKDDKVLRKVLDARQLGLKLISNVTYGYTAASFSGRMPCVELADSIVSKGRETLERAIKTVEATSRWGGKVIYGDTDSMFVLLQGKTKEQAFQIGQEIAEVVTAQNPKPIKLKFEKVYLPCVLQTKKRYVGFSYESPDQAEPTYDAKGIETVRRDTCPAVSKLLEKSLRLLFAAGEVAPVKNYLKLQFSKMLSEQVNLQDFIFAKEFRGLSGYKPGACVPALEIARRMVRKDPRLEPRVGERVPYVVVYGSPGLRLIQLVRHPLEVLSDPSLRLNVHYYVTRAVGPALNRVLGLVGQDALQWYGELPRPASGTAGVVRGRGGPNTIGRYLVCQLCPACGAQSPKEGLCPACRADPGFAALALGDRVHRVQAALHDIQQICQSCMGFRGSECISTDCPILYKKARVTHEAKQARAWHNTNSTAQARGFASHH